MAFFDDYPTGVNGGARGMRFPKIVLGNYSLNMVLQAETCCAEDVSTNRWEEGGALGLMTSGTRSDAQKRIGLLGTQAEALTGLYNRGRPVGPVGALGMGPMILGFVHRDGRLTVFKNGAKLGTYDAVSNATTAFEYVNGWLDSNVTGAGQIAEIKLYKQPFTDDVMKVLHEKLICKWGLDGDPVWDTCARALPKAPDDDGSPNHVGYTIWPQDSDSMVGSFLVPRTTARAFRDYLPSEEVRPQILALSSARPYVLLYLVDPMNVPFSVSQQPPWTGDGTIFGWEALEPILGPLGFPMEHVVPGMSLFIPATDTSTAQANADGEVYTYTQKAREVRVHHKQRYSDIVTDFVPLDGSAFPIVPASFPVLFYEWEVTMEGNAEFVPVVSEGPEWSGTFTSSATACATGSTCEELCIQASAGHLAFVLPTETSSTDPIEFQPLAGEGSDVFVPAEITRDFTVQSYIEHDRSKDIGIPCDEEILSSPEDIPTPLFNIRFVGGTHNGESIGYPSAMPVLPGPPVQIL